MECQRCESTRVLEIQAKCNDMFSMWMDEKEYQGYVPDEIGIGGGDYIEFAYCLDCGQIQKDFPLDIEDSFEDDELEDDEWED